MSSSLSRNATSTPEPAPGSPPDADLERALGHRFDDPALLARALTHKSHSRDHNERLEFLGDAVLGYLVADALYDEQPDAHEDTMSLLRASLVRKESLADIARSIGLGAHLRLGAGVKRGGGHRLDSLLADALEAVIGAVHLDGGIEAARTVVTRLLAARMRSLDAESLKDAKTRLQETLQGAGLELPEYSIESTRGSAHAKVFTVRCRVSEFDLSVEAEGRSRRGAEKLAAERMLERIQERLGAS